jgi:hypothetical protein
MQLRVARLCHDCEEVHADQHCPVCASETFTFITRWVPAPERRAKSRPTPVAPPEADVYRRLTQPDTNERGAGRLWKRAAVGLTAVGMAGWLWQRASVKSDDRRDRTTPKS